MSIEGLNYILDKKELIPTVSAQDLLNRPSQVEADYKRHVRTYVPINHIAQGREGILTVEDFERKLFNAVKNAKSPRGYLTAEYGYGKTSTAIYLWEQGEKQNLIVVPPFQLLNLPDLVMATHGWVRYKLSEHGYQYVEELDQLYDKVINRSIEQEAERGNINVTMLKTWVDEGKFNLDLQPDEYIRYFEEVTRIALSAGYAGLILLPDEIQQYIEPLMKRSGDPIVPFFNLLQGLATREGYLNFGLILVTVPKELDIIREGRGRKDLIHRMRELSLDLTYVYDSEFPERLWDVLANAFNFKDVSKEIVASETLLSLGEIIIRNDLSDGPRTVINTFKRMVQRYLTDNNILPYTPIDMIDDFLNGVIAFAGNNKIPSVTRRALQSNFVKGHPDTERAVKLAAAFPVNGASVNIQRAFKVDKATDGLKHDALGELVIGVGKAEDGGITLFGLQSGSQQHGWLPAKVREIRTVYNEFQDIPKDRAISVFIGLLKTHIFKNWKVVDERSSSLVSNQSIIFEGEFQSFATRYPKRRVHVRIIWDDNEERKDAEIDGDVAIEFYLSLRPDLIDDIDKRRSHAYPAKISLDENIALIPINLLYFQLEKLSPQIGNALKDVWMPYDLSPMILMNIYKVIDESREENLIPRGEDQEIKNAFQPELLDNIISYLFNADVGATLDGVAKGRITEVAIERLLDEKYRDTYRTIMASSTWKSTLNKYASALDRLDNVYQKRGEVEFEGTKTEIAKFMTLSNSVLDNFISQYPLLITVTKEWVGNNMGAVKFTLHDLEQRIMKWLRASNRVEKTKISGQSIEIHSIEVSNIYLQARTLGYKDEEIEALLGLLVGREMIEYHQNHIIREKPSISIDIEEIAQKIREFNRDVQVLSGGFSGSQITTFKEYAENLQSILDTERQNGNPDPQRVHRLGKRLDIRNKELRDFALDKQKDISKLLQNLQRNLRLINPQHITILSTQVDGGVEYVQHVNSLRNALSNHANTVKSNLDSLRNAIQRIIDNVDRPDISYESLASYASDANQFDARIVKAKDDIDNFEMLYRHFGDWQRLVSDGSRLLDDLQKMGNRVIEYQNTFNRLVNSIREAISTQSNKLDVLPNHSIYSSQMNQLHQKVREIRDQDRDAFIETQNSYFQLFSTKFGFKRDEMSPFEYNIAYPDESYRLLYTKVGDLARKLWQRISQGISAERQQIGQILTTPMLNTLILEVRQTIETQGKEIVEQTTNALSKLVELEKYIDDPVVIKNYQPNNTGGFAELMSEINQVVEFWRGVKTQVTELSKQINEASLTQEEDVALNHVRTESIEDALDIFEWQSSAGLSHEEFWQVFRSLYEKQRIRILVTKVRR